MKSPTFRYELLSIVHYYIDLGVGSSIASVTPIMFY
jgi:hypothetical protein